MLPNRSTLAVLLAAMVVGSAFAVAGTASSHTAGNDAPSDGLVVTDLSAPASTAPNATVEVAATVENPGTSTVTESVEFRVGGTVVDRQWVTLDPGQRTTVSFSADTSGLAPGEYLHGVLAETDGAFASLTVSESFTVDSLDAPANATSGANVSIAATVTNPNDANATQEVTFRFAGGVLAEETLTLAPGETTNVTIDLTLNGVAEGTYVHGLLTRDSGQLATLAVTPSNATVEPAAVTFADQNSDGTMVTVDSVTVPEGGFVTIHDATLLDGNVVGSVVGVSDVLEPGTHENVTVPLFTVPGGPSGPSLNESSSLIAMPHLDTNGNGIYDFVTSGGMDDGPYLDNGSAVTDAANVTVGMETPNGTETPGEETPTPGEETPTPGEETQTPGTETPTGTAAPASVPVLEVLLPGLF